MRRIIASATRITILVPRATDIRILLVYLEGDVVEVPLKLVGHQQTACTSTNDDNPDWAIGVDRAGHVSLFSTTQTNQIVF